MGFELLRRIPTLFTCDAYLTLGRRVDRNSIRCTPIAPMPTTDMEDHFELSIGSYGTVRGFVNPATSVAEVRGIPYATIPGRFRSPVLCKKLDEGTHDGTKFGYLGYDFKLTKLLVQLAPRSKMKLALG
jgi:hypothetical protein